MARTTVGFKRRATTESTFSRRFGRSGRTEFLMPEREHEVAHAVLTTSNHRHGPCALRSFKSTDRPYRGGAADPNCYRQHGHRHVPRQPGANGGEPRPWAVGHPGRALALPGRLWRVHLFACA